METAIVSLLVMVAVFLMEYRLSRIQASCRRLLAEVEQANRYLGAVSANLGKQN